MMKIVGIAMLFALSAAQVAASEDGNDQRVEQSRAVVKAFVTSLKGEMKSAMKEGGPIKAIEVCNMKAPAITQELSMKKGWKIGRTSLKVRNLANAPDAWEKAVLEKFDARKAAGESPKKMEHYEVVTMDGKQVFRYMKAIPTAEKPCLVCHGANIDPKVAATIDKYYPNDQARGYKAGDIRGAFTIIQPMM